MIDIIPDDLIPIWLSNAPGAFSVKYFSPKVEIQEVLIDKFERLVKQGLLEHYGDLRGWYQPTKNELEELDYINATDAAVDIWLPFGLSDLVEIHAGNVIIVAGAPNSGKTAVFLNMILQNRPKDWDIYYFSSEMGAGELRKRLNKVPDISLEQWQFKAFRRAENFHEVIRPGGNSLNIIDFLEVHDNFYEIGAKIKKIHDKLKGGIAVIGIQKNPGNDTGLGGYRTIEVTRLAISLDFGKVKIVKAKNFKDPERNPNRKWKNFKLIDGWRLKYDDAWYHDET